MLNKIFTEIEKNAIIKENKAILLDLDMHFFIDMFSEIPICCDEVKRDDSFVSRQSYKVDINKFNLEEIEKIFKIEFEDFPDYLTEVYVNIQVISNLMEEVFIPEEITVELGCPGWFTKKERKLSTEERENLLRYVKYNI